MIFKTTKISQKIIGGFLLVALIPLALANLLGFTNSRRTLEAEKISELSIIADLKRDRINTFVDTLIIDITAAQDYWNIKTNLPTVTRLVSDQDSPNYKEAKDTLDGQLKTLQDVKKYLDVLLFDTQGNLVYTTGITHKSDELGEPLGGLGHEAVIRGLEKIYFTTVFASEFAPSGFEMLVTAPVRDFDDEVIGVVVFPVDMGPVYDSVLDTTGLGDTGETLIGRFMAGHREEVVVGHESDLDDTDHVVFLNPLRHEPGAALEKEIAIGGKTALPIQEAAQGVEGAGISVDYRGEPIVAAWRIVLIVNWGLVAKIDVAEAFASLTILRNQELVLSAVLVVGIIGLAYLISSSITRPVVKAAVVAKEIEGG